jgi:hypothetical protein
MLVEARATAGGFHGWYSDVGALAGGARLERDGSESARLVPGPVGLPVSAW